MKKNKQRDLFYVTDDTLEDPESDFEEAHELDFNDRDEGHIYESIEDEIDLDEVLRELPDVEIDLEE